MAVQVNTLTGYVIDGNETNAGARAFVRDLKAYMLDGAEFGSAGERAFVRHVTARIIDGGAYSGARVNGFSGFIIEKLSQPEIRVPQIAAFEIEGTPQDRIKASQISLHIIETE